ncbi:MAG: M50 family metallopeptidase [Armatimonadetes bacterium]|nr:M50 family metallopeptidase [Armatimonadota bacterium]
MNLERPVTRAFLIAIALSIVLPYLPIVRLLLLPFDYLNTHLHEMFHALTAILTGGQVSHIQVFTDGSGVTFTRGGLTPAIQMAGYLGSSLFGAAMIQSATNEKAARIWLQVLGGMVLVSNVIWVRGDLVGWTIGLAWPVVILVLASRLKGDSLVFAAQFFAVQQCLNALKSVRDLVLLARTDVPTDAQLMAQSTHIPAIVWALLWAGVSLFGIGLAVVKMNSSVKRS